MQATKSLELRIAAAAIDENAFENLAESLQALGTSSETDADSGIETLVAWFEVDDDETGLRARVIAASLLAGAPAGAVQLKTLDAADWSTAWQEQWHAMPVGRRLWVRPSFCEAAPADHIDIVLDPGMAFGTGQHPTTRLCLEAIERLCDQEAPVSLLDMGAGSGILAIAAAKLGAGEVLAIDNDPDSVEACEVNSRINGVAIRSELGDTPPARRFSLVVANILAGPLIDMAPKLADCVEHDLILSGLLTTQVEGIVRAYESHGLSVTRSDTEGEWASVEFNRQ
ncbi:MAG TPA: 50S ribosomal protein L11 methyltransferase [Mariprofundaceae bacterium]|nr:50S ribosomal protein L11 methyltransferase [Mariprofundaceae bacterium]